MSIILKSPKGLKDLECKKGQLTSRPPIPYVPPTDLLTTKESLYNFKIKLPNGTKPRAFTEVNEKDIN